MGRGAAGAVVAIRLRTHSHRCFTFHGVGVAPSHLEGRAPPFELPRPYRGPRTWARGRVSAASVLLQPLSQGRRSETSRVADARLRSWPMTSSSHSWTTSHTSAGRASLTVRSTPAEMSVLMRIEVRRGSDDPGSIQARMISSPVGPTGAVSSRACRSRDFVWSDIRAPSMWRRVLVIPGCRCVYPGATGARVLSGIVTGVP
ncbi:MAG: hypothetical protein QOF81_1414 [Acidimicrobiaceae bacterium]|nr:hypothetical protein [Acidimicrobiaceae bacterium]